MIKKPEGEYEIDHVDGNPCNIDMITINKFGRPGNLEYVSKTENMRRSTLTLISKDAMVCIFEVDGKYQVNCKYEYLGRYDKLEDAIKIRDEALLEENWADMKTYKAKKCNIKIVSEKTKDVFKEVHKKRNLDELIKCDEIRKVNEEVFKGSWAKYPKCYLKVHLDEVCVGKDPIQCKGKHAHVHYILTDKMVIERCVGNSNYVAVKIYDNVGGRAYVSVHQFGAVIATGREYSTAYYEEVCHIDGIPEHNAPCNLKYGTKKR